MVGVAHTVYTYCSSNTLTAQGGGRGRTDDSGLFTLPRVRALPFTSTRYFVYMYIPPCSSQKPSTPVGMVSVRRGSFIHLIDPRQNPKVHGDTKKNYTKTFKKKKNAPPSINEIAREQRVRFIELARQTRGKSQRQRESDRGKRHTQRET